MALTSVALFSACGGDVAAQGASRPGAGGAASYSGSAASGGTVDSGGIGGRGGMGGEDANAGSAGANTCGDGMRTGQEVCDGDDLGVDGCQSVGFTAGWLACSASCESFDTAGCRKVVSIAAGDYHTCALLEEGNLKCWGSNDYGQLGYGDKEDRGDEPGEMGEALPAVDLGSGRRAKQVAAGGEHTCALLDDGTVKCWGRNSWGQLGLGDTMDRGDEAGEMGDALPTVDLGAGQVAMALGAGGGVTCAVLEAGTIKCWGSDAAGELGLGDLRPRGGKPGEMGDALAPVELGTDRLAKAVTVSGAFVCALLVNASSKCWGYNDHGQLGLGDTDSRGDQPGEMGDALPAVDLGTGRSPMAVSAGGGFTCALLDNAQVKCWGANTFLDGQLGLGDTNNRGDQPGEMGDALPAVDLGIGRLAVGLSAGGFHTCALLDNAQVKCWGHNGGTLGLGDTSARGDEPGEMGDALPSVDLGAGRYAQTIVSGWAHTCALLDNAQVKCWGDNTLHGQLGLGDRKTRGDEPGEMGDALLPVEL
jgi:alpha-tubulin suppressor-like RCC1 family protein